MAHLHLRNNNNKTSFLSSIGSKVKNVAEFAGAVKGIYDTGKMIYNGVRAFGPMISPIIETAGLLL